MILAPLALFSSCARGVTSGCAAGEAATDSERNADIKASKAIGSVKEGIVPSMNERT